MPAPTADPTLNRRDEYLSADIAQNHSPCIIQNSAPADVSRMWLQPSHAPKNHMDFQQKSSKLRENHDSRRIPQSSTPSDESISLSNPAEVLQHLKLAVQSHFAPVSRHSQRAAALIRNDPPADSGNSPPPLPPPSERPNTKPLFKLLASKKEKFEAKCPLRIEGFLQLLDDYPSPEFPKLLTEIIQYGAKLGYDGPMDVTVKQGNHPSANANTKVIADEIEKELSLNRLKKLPALPQRYYCSPLGLVPNTAEGKQTGWRRIFDLSSPKNQSVNDHIAKEFGYLQYETFDEAVAAIAKAGQNATLLKCDLKLVFRMIPVCTEDQWLLIFEWDGKYYQELFLPFGLRTAPFIFNLFGEALQWILHRKYSYVIKRYLDDFLFILPPTVNPSEVQQAGAQFKIICTALGFSEAEDKSKDGTRVDYLGLILDTAKMEA
jgi:Reverse transcriptase (RNA-dependent DNA polymerase)